MALKAPQATKAPQPVHPPIPQSARLQPTPDELKDVKLAAQHLWSLDFNRFVPDVDYALNLQHGKKVFQTEDVADQPLFKFVKKEKFFATPTYKAFYALLDNYVATTGVAETVTAEESRENRAFIDALMETAPMKYLHNYLAEKKLAPRSLQEFKALLDRIWFSLFRRETANDSSGFEHVFVGEERDGKIIGFHNWIQFFIEELKKNVDYYGYVLPKRRNAHLPDGHDPIVSVQFSWKGELKNVSTILIGASPEFEIALYTLMFLASGEETEVVFGGTTVVLHCFKINTRAGQFLGTCYPDLVE